jgi:hypothetical protein
VNNIDLNAPSAGELIDSSPPVKDGSKGSRNIKRVQADGYGARKRGSTLGFAGRGKMVTPIEQPPKTRYETRRNYLNLDRETCSRPLSRMCSTKWTSIRPLRFSFTALASVGPDDPQGRKRPTLRMLDLTRSGGHLKVTFGGVHTGEQSDPVYPGTQATNGRSGWTWWIGASTPKSARRMPGVAR